MQNFYKEFLSFKSIFYFCALPLRLDSYKGCEHGCLYCFSQQLNNRQKPFFTNPLPADPKEFLRIFESSQKNDQNFGPVRSCLHHGLPIHFGSVSDPFQPIELKEEVSFQILDILRKYDYPVIISTKSSLIATNKYIKIIQNMPIGIQFSFSTFDENLSKRLEPHAPSPKERLEAIRKLTDANIWVAIRLQPFLYPLSNSDEINFRDLAKLNVRHVVLEHLRIPTNSSINSRNKLFQGLGENILEKFREMGLQNSRINFELSSENKLKNIINIREKVHSAGITFGSGDNDFHHFSDDHCCCGLPNDIHFKNTYKGNICYAIFKSINNNEIQFNNIHDEWQPSGSLREFINSDCRLDSNSAIDLLTDKIKSPNKSNSPVSFYGVKYSEKLKKYLFES